MSIFSSCRLFRTAAVSKNHSALPRHLAEGEKLSEQPHREREGGVENGGDKFFSPLNGV